MTDLSISSRIVFFLLEAGEVGRAVLALRLLVASSFFFVFTVRVKVLGRFSHHGSEQVLRVSGARAGITER